MSKEKILKLMSQDSMLALCYQTLFDAEAFEEEVPEEDIIAYDVKTVNGQSYVDVVTVSELVAADIIMEE